MSCEVDPRWRIWASEFCRCALVWLGVPGEWTVSILRHNSRQEGPSGEDAVTSLRMVLQRPVVGVDIYKVSIKDSLHCPRMPFKCSSTLLQYRCLKRAAATSPLLLRYGQRLNDGRGDGVYCIVCLILVTGHGPTTTILV